MPRTRMVQLSVCHVVGRNPKLSSLFPSRLIVDAVVPIALVYPITKMAVHRLLGDSLEYQESTCTVVPATHIHEFFHENIPDDRENEDDATSAKIKTTYGSSSSSSLICLEKASYW